MSLRCGICFENAQPSETKDWRALLCGHVYHAHCLEQSFEHTKRCCPSCRVGSCTVCFYRAVAHPDMCMRPAGECPWLPCSLCLALLSLSISAGTSGQQEGH